MNKGGKVWIIWCLVAGLFLAWGMMGCAKKEVKTEAPVQQSAEDEQLKALKAKEEAEAAKKKVRIREEEVAVKEPGKDLSALEKEKSLAWKKEKEAFEMEDLYFDYDQYVLTTKARDLLQKKVEWLKRNSQAKVQVEGHCDDRGSTEYNLALGDRRADSVKQYLVSLGISTDRISTISYGKEKPLDPGQTEEAWARNRRAHFVVR